MRRFIGALIVLVAVCGMVVADETNGVILKVEDGSITVRTGGLGFGKKGSKGEEKTYKVAKDVKITRVAGKDKEEVKLTLDEVKTALKVTGFVGVTVVHDGDEVKELKIGLRGFGGGKGGKGKDKKGKDKKDDF